jgi:acyl-CoA synthetase (AMP-forming)/AMP-acid ligase II
MMKIDSTNVADAIARWAHQRPEAIAVIEGRRRVSYAAFDKAVWRAAASWRASGILPGQTVGVCLPNSALYLVAFYGLARIGATVLPLPLDQPEQHRAGLLRRFGAAAIIAAGREPSVRQLLPDQAWLDDAPHVPDPGLRADGGDRALKIAFSSGTTGQAKAVLRTHRNSIEIDRHRRQAVPQFASDVFVALLDMGVSYGLRPCLRTLDIGATVVVAPPGIGAAEFIAFVEQCNATQLALTPFHAMMLLAKPVRPEPMLPGVRELIVSTANCPHSLRQQIRARLTPKLIVSYGSNEVNVLAVADGNLQDQFPESVGRCIPGIEVEAVDERDVPVPAGTMGLLRFRAPWFPAGYIDDPEASAKSFRNGWFYPGDVGLVTPDHAIQLKGRADDIINYDGIKIAPLEIESAMLAHPAVVEAASVGLPSALHQQIPIVAVTLRRPASSDDLLSFARRRMGTRAPVQVVVVDSLPKNAMGKVLKKDLAHMIAIDLQKRRDSSKSG